MKKRGRWMRFRTGIRPTVTRFAAIAENLNKTMDSIKGHDVKMKAFEKELRELARDSNRLQKHAETLQGEISLT